MITLVVDAAVAVQYDSLRRVFNVKHGDAEAEARQDLRPISADHYWCMSMAHLVRILAVQLVSQGYVGLLGKRARRNLDCVLSLG